MKSLLTDEKVAELLAASPAEHVTLDYIKSRIIETKFTRFIDTVTLCNIKLDNGYSVRGESACVDAKNYNQELGENFAYTNAMNKLWPLFGFLLAEKIHLHASAPVMKAPAEKEPAEEDKKEAA